MSQLVDEAEESDEHIIAILKERLSSKRLESSSPDAWCKAVLGLGRLAKKGDAQIIQLLWNGFQDQIKKNQGLERSLIQIQVIEAGSQSGIEALASECKRKQWAARR